MLFDYGVNLLFDQEGNFDSRKRNEKKMGINKIDWNVAYVGKKFSVRWKGKVLNQNIFSQNFQINRKNWITNFVLWERPCIT